MAERRADYYQNHSTRSAQLSPIEAAMARLLRSLYVQEQAARAERRGTLTVVDGGRQRDQDR